VVAHAAYGAMIHDPRRHVGGVERQTTLLSRWLAARGHDVSLVTWDEGQQDGARIGGVRMVKTCRREQGLPGLRFVHPRWTGLVAALRRADADVYYHNCGEYVTGQVALWSRRRRRAFVYGTASDTDCDPRLPALPRRRERVLYRYGLRHADRVIVQTRAQQDRLREGFGLDSVVIPAPCPGPDDAEYEARARPLPGAAPVLWVGRIAPEKRPDRLLDLAEARPALAFQLVGPGGATAYAREILARGQRIANVTVHGAVGRDELARLYRLALCLCSTSDYEGFPNTFLEAWSHGLPVVSTVDPDGLIARLGLGGVASGVPGLAAAIDALDRAPLRWAQASARARAYYLENHRPDAALLRIEEVFREAVASRGVRAPRSGR
jgi:glycosyltransferase involved in cell wall biosynthesis